MAPTWIFAISTINNLLSLSLNMPHIAILYIMPAEKYLGARNNRLMLIHIAALDIITSGIRLPLDNEYMQYAMEKHHWFCGLTAVLGYGPHLVMEFILVIGCIDRLIAVRHPTSYSQWFLPKHIAWFYLIPYAYWITALTSLTVIHEETLLVPRGFMMCYYDPAGTRAMLPVITGSLVLSMLTIFILYSAILITVCSRRTVTARGEAGYAVQAAKIIMVIVVTHLLLWICAPLNVLIQIAVGKPIDALWYIAPILVAFNSATHPPIYGFLNRK